MSNIEFRKIGESSNGSEAFNNSVLPLGIQGANPCAQITIDKWEYEKLTVMSRSLHSMQLYISKVFFIYSLGLLRKFEILQSKSIHK